MYLSTGNKKLKGTKEVRFLIFNLPAVKTCPYRTKHCEKFCYARKAERVYPGCLPCREKNLAASKCQSFDYDMKRIIERRLKNKTYKNAKKIYFRIHESGDFYSQSYFDSWVKIATAFPSVVFLAYTKSVKYVLHTAEKIPANMIIRFSLWDDTKAEEKALAEDLQLPTYTAERLTKDGIKALADRFCDCIDCGDCGKCYDTKVKHIVTEIH